MEPWLLSVLEKEGNEINYMQATVYKVLLLEGGPDYGASILPG